MKITIKDCTYLNADLEAIQGSIGIEEDRIAWISDQIPANWIADEIILGTNKLATPGLVNTHNHAAMVLLRSYADDLLLQDWLQKEIWPIEANLTGEDVYWGTQLSLLEMIRTGTTTFCDMYFFMDQVAETVEKSGMRAVLCRGITSIGNDGEEKLKESEELFHTWHGKGEGRISVWHGPHAPYTCSPEFLKKVIASAERLNMNIHIHLSETAQEVKDCFALHDKSPIALMDSLGMFEVHTLGAHCVHLSKEDMDLLSAKKVNVAHNPGSNLKLASGISPVAELKAKNITVALGTDGAASNNNQDLLEEIRLAALLHKATTNDPTTISAKEALAMGTSEGAKALALPELGLIQVGYKADLVLFDMSEPHWYPKHNLLANLVYSANSSDVSDVVINGKIVLKDKEHTTLDKERILFEASGRTKSLIERRQKN